jgi:uncharacterized protein
VDIETLRAIAKAHHVKRLELFGSVAKGSLSPNDYDFLVEFEQMEPILHGRMYFKLLETLEATLNKKVDLVELPVLKNPYFLKAIESQRTLLYAA